MDNSTLVQIHDNTQGTVIQEQECFMIHVTFQVALTNSDLSSLYSQYILVVSYATLSNRSTTYDK